MTSYSSNKYNIEADSLSRVDITFALASLLPFSVLQTDIMSQPRHEVPYARHLQELVAKIIARGTS